MVGPAVCRYVGYICSLDKWEARIKKNEVWQRRSRLMPGAWRASKRLAAGVAKDKN